MIGGGQHVEQWCYRQAFGKEGGVQDRRALAGEVDDGASAKSPVIIFLEFIPELFCKRFWRLAAQRYELIECVADSRCVGNVICAEEGAFLVVGKGIEHEGHRAGEVLFHGHACDLPEQPGKALKAGGHIFGKEQPPAGHGDARMFSLP